MERMRWSRIRGTGAITPNRRPVIDRHIPDTSLWTRARRRPAEWVFSGGLRPFVRRRRAGAAPIGCRLVAAARRAALAAARTTLLTAEGRLLVLGRRHLLLLLRLLLRLLLDDALLLSRLRDEEVR